MCVGEWGALRHERTASLSPSRVCAGVCICVVRDECTADLSELKILPKATFFPLVYKVVL